MPSQTVYFSSELYDYIRDTADGSFSARAVELMEQGKEVETDE